MGSLLSQRASSIMLCSGKSCQVLRLLAGRGRVVVGTPHEVSNRFRSTQSKRKPLRVYYPEPKVDPTRDVYLGGPEAEFGNEVLRDAAISRRIQNRPGQKRQSTVQTVRDEPAHPRFEVEDPVAPSQNDSHATYLRQKGLPKIVPIHAWDKNNKNIRGLRNTFLRKTVKVKPQTSDQDLEGNDDAEENEQMHMESRKGAKEKEGPDEVLVLETKILIKEAMERGIDPQTFVTSRIGLLEDFPLENVKNKDSIRLFWLPYQTISGWSDLTTSPGFMATFNKKDLEREARRPNRHHLGITVILDNVRTPDNLGGILRLAASIGAQQVIATSGCVDAWQPKVLRAGAGAHFNIPVRTGVKWTEVGQHLPENSQVVVCDSSAAQSNPMAPSGGENLKQLIDEGERQRCTDPQSGLKYDYSFDDEEMVEKFSRCHLEETPVSQMAMNDPKVHMVVVIGGETEGVSRKAHMFAHQAGGVRAFIPLFNSMESLNNLSAASILLYHCQMQCLKAAS